MKYIMCGLLTVNILFNGLMLYSTKQQGYFNAMLGWLSALMYAIAYYGGH